MLEYDYQLIALANGWLKLKLGWYHPLAQQYIGWGLEFKCFTTAEEAVKYMMEVTMYPEYFEYSHCVLYGFGPSKCEWMIPGYEA